MSITDIHKRDRFAGIKTNGNLIPKNIIDEFKELYKADYNCELSDVDALEKCEVLFAGLDAIFTPSLTESPKKKQYKIKHKIV